MLPSPSQSSEPGHAAVADFLGKVPAGAQHGRRCSLAGPARLVLCGIAGNPLVLLGVLLWMGASPCLWVVWFTSLRSGQPWSFGVVWGGLVSFGMWTPKEAPG